VRFLLIGLGGAVGSVLRYWLSGLVQSGAGVTAFPLGTLAVNVAGCFAIGVLAELAGSRAFFDPDIRGLVMVGLIGGFTTFSTFAYETLEATPLVAVANVLLSVGWACRLFGQDGDSLRRSGDSTRPLLHPKPDITWRRA
jgi:fluoride exporter